MSATIGNPMEVLLWMRKLKPDSVEWVNFRGQRPVPLDHMVFNPNTSPYLVNLPELIANLTVIIVEELSAISSVLFLASKERQATMLSNLAASELNRLIYTVDSSGMAATHQLMCPVCGKVCVNQDEVEEHLVNSKHYYFMSSEDFENLTFWSRKKNTHKLAKKCFPSQPSEAYQTTSPFLVAKSSTAAASSAATINLKETEDQPETPNMTQADALLLTVRRFSKKSFPLLTRALFRYFFSFKHFMKRWRLHQTRFGCRPLND